MSRRVQVALLGLVCFGAACVGRPSSQAPIERKRSALDLIGKATSITAGDLHSCALLDTGRVYCWGRGLAGQLGDGNVLTTPEPVEVQGLTDAISIWAGDEDTCAIRQGGQAVCWGNDDPRHPVGSPLPVVVAGLTNAVSIAPRFEKSCAARSDGTVVCWGAATTASPTLVPVPGLSDATIVVGGNDHMCALRSTGAVACWGSGFFSQLGNGSTTANVDVPVAVTGLTDAVALAAGMFHTCAVRTGGQVVCWGQGGGGRLGDGLSTTSAVPVTVSGLTDAVAVTAGGSGSCAVRANGALACWGSSLLLGDGSGVTSPVPVAAVGLTDVVSVAAGLTHACALQGDGEVLCWGNGEHGQVGNGRYAQVAKPVPVVGVTDAVSVDGSSAHTCAVRTTGAVACWGQNDSGALGDGTTAFFSYVPVTVGGLSDAVAVVVGHSHSCALRATGEVACWGTGGQGELGNGSSGSGVKSSVPVAVTGLSDAVAIASGESFTCALRQGGGVVCWGANVPVGGFLGKASSPAAVPGLSDAVAIGARDYHACAIRAGGAVVCWGEGGQGRLGNGGTDDSAVPVPVSGLTDAVAVMPGRFHTCAVRAGGGVMCWGDNSDGQLGIGTGGPPSSPVPVAVPGLSDARSGGSGVWHTCVRRATGALACWGAGFWGQLGNGAIDQASSPVAVVGLTDAVLVEAGGYTTCAIRSGGALSCWGEGTQGQLGDGGPWKSSVPVGVLGLSIPKTPLGGSCATDGACAGNRCVDGVCCQSDCNRTDLHRCVACAAGTGACTPLPARTPCRAGSGDLCDLGGLCDGTSDTCPTTNTPADPTTQCYTRQDFCDSVEPALTCGGALSCPARTSWDGCNPASSNPATLFGGVVRGGGALPSGGVEVTFTPSWNGTIAARRVKSGCPDKPGFDLLPENDSTGQGYYWEIKAEPPITCAAGQMNCVNMQVCVQYDEQWIIDAGWGNPSDVEGSLQLLHGIAPAGGGDGCDPTGNGWMPDRTIPVDTVNNIVCVPANTLSPFGLFIPKPGSMPTLHVPASVVAEATGPGGAVVTYTATATDVPDGPLTPSCLPASGTKFPLGTTTVNCTVVDHDGLSAKASFPVTVQDTKGPVFSNVPGPIVVYATSTAGAKVTYTPPKAVDAVDGPCNVTCAPGSGTVFAPGQKPVTCTASDKKGTSTSVSFSVSVQYQAPADGSFFLLPMRANGSSIFRIGRPVPVRFRLTGASAGITNLHATLLVTKVSNAVQGSAEDASDETDEDTDFQFKYFAPLKFYRYRWKTRDQTQGTYRLSAVLGDGVKHEINVSLKGPK